MQRRMWAAPCGIISMDRNGTIIKVNETFHKWMGYESAEDLEGVNLESLMSIANKMIYHSYFIPEIHLHKLVEELYINFKGKDGLPVPFLMNARQAEYKGELFIDCILVKMKKRIDYEQELRATKQQLEEAYIEKDKAYAQLEKINQEIKEKQKELMLFNTQLVELSNTDKLTGIPNRRYLQERLADQVELYKTKGIPFSLLMLDIDHFKAVNDTYGHQVGDDVLMQLAEILKRQSRLGDCAARYGGEEFTVILPNTHAADAITYAQRLNRAVETNEWKIISGLTISIGVAEFRDNDNETTIIEKADQALYTSKHNGRNRSTLFEEPRADGAVKG